MTKILLMIIMLASTIIGSISPAIQAATFSIKEANLYSKGSYSNMLKYNGVELLTTFVVYKKDGIEYPAYCLDANKPGVGENGSYIAKVDSLLNDVMLWRVITNGYPYKTPQELGCQTKEEAFVATKQAVYCMIYGREASWYEAIGDKGIRVKNAMAQILKNAKASTVGKPSSNIDIKETKEDWTMDIIWKNCVSKTFEVNASTSYNTYNVSLEGDYPAETKIVNENNQIKTTFSTGERFKLVIPLKNMNQDGNFKVKVTTKLNTKPVLYGKAPSSDLQDYALTASIYEDAEGSKTLYYFKNETKLEVKKLEAKTLKVLSGVEFRILDSNKNPIYTNLITDEQGKIMLSNLLPGRYYLEEVKAKEGYLKYDGQIAFDLALNQTLTIKVNNTLEKKSEQVTNTQNINVSQSKQEIVIKDNQEVSSKNDNTTIVDKTQIQQTSNQNTNIHKEENNQMIGNENINVNQNKSTTNIDIQNKNENHNKNEQNQNTNINNENMNNNSNIQNQNTDIYNQNVNNNNNEQNQNTNIENENTSTNVNIQNKTTNIKTENVNTNINTQNQSVNVQEENVNTNINTQNQSANVQGQNVNTNINTQNQSTSVQYENTNTNTNVQNQTSNISAFNGVVKLPKTGM